MSQREPPRKGRVLRAVCQEASEDHLGVALIQPGGSRYEQTKRQIIRSTAENPF